jgi:non-heme Fe2+,alpha-ketoglutarate-dependent halogenase
VTTSLDPDQIERCRRDGLLSPIPVLTSAEVGDFLNQYHATRALDLDLARRALRAQGHLVFPWLAELASHPRVLDAVEGIIGPDILCWTVAVFDKAPGTPAYVSWHQDATYWGLEGGAVYSAWIALTPSTPESGCMRVVPGTIRAQAPHVDTFDPDNLLTRGQALADPVDEAAAVDVVLAPGEMSLHHVMIMHGSGPNRSALPRTGIAIRYAAPATRQTGRDRDFAMLVRGNDRFGHFELVPPPVSDFDPAGVARFETFRAGRDEVLYRGAAIPPPAAGS